MLRARSGRAHWCGPVDGESRRDQANAHRAGATARLSADDFTGAADLLESAHLLLVQFEAPLSTVLPAISWAHRSGRRVLLDAAPAVSLPEEVWRQVYLVRTNAREASLLTGVEVHDADTAALTTTRLGAEPGLPRRKEVLSLLHELRETHAPL
jgi:sugar/nucleoside kinase (ribokinase family)